MAKSKAKAKQVKNPQNGDAPPPIMNKAQLQILLIMILVLGGIFMPTTIMVCIGMLPTFVAFLTQKKDTRIRALTIGAMNMAGCSPYLLQLWVEGHSFDNSFSIILDPRTIIIMYMCAAIGYVIDWAVTEFVSSLLYERGLKRKDEMKEHQEAMIERWGEKVTGRYELDEDGFPLAQVDAYNADIADNKDRSVS